MNSWEKILQHMERRVNPHSFATWFRPTRQEGAENGKLVVRVPSRVFRKRLTETYGELMQAVLVEIGMTDIASGISSARRTIPRPPANRLPSRRAWTSIPWIISSIRATRLRLLWSALPISSRTPPRRPSPSSPPKPTTRSSSTAAWAWARPT